MDHGLELLRVKETLSKIGTRPIYSYGQNFLLDRSISRTIAAEVPERYIENIFEIGPGLGILTKALLTMGAKVRAIEKDDVLSSNLDRIIGPPLNERLEMIKGDALNILPRMITDGKEDVFIVSNLPFNISSRLIGGILDQIEIGGSNPNHFKGGVIMFQEEFANRIISEPGSKAYGRISVMFRSKMKYHEVLKVSRNSFYPVPKVNASVIAFEPKTKFNIIPMDNDMFSKLVHVVFLNRRKKLKNTVNPKAIGIDLGIDDIKWILDDMGITDLRPENLSSDTFITLSNRLFDLA